MAITASLVKELREKTAAGMMDCKKALEACDGDLDKAIDWLREKGIMKAAKKADRVAAEGLTAFVTEGNTCAMVEVNSETDFVAKNAEFQELVKTVAKEILKANPSDLDEALKINVGDKDLATLVAEASGKIGEKLDVRRFVVLTKNDDEVFGAYSHMGGKMSAIVKASGLEEEKARDVAMQVAACSPSYISEDDIPAADMEHETSVQRQIMASDEKMASKPEKILEGILKGKIKKHFAELCLMDQEFIKTPKETVKQYVGTGKILEMARFEVGEGIEKKEENFAEEVAAQMGK
ncbi:MAG: translation elongation factor Ts [Thomasclavelia sp.]|jgi:elongation factor Ts|nr:translation elongation factor Ts [Thomasclavelia sp.]